MGSKPVCLGCKFQENIRGIMPENKDKRNPPWSIRPYPEIKEPVEKFLDNLNKFDDREMSRNHFVMQCIALQIGVPVQLIEKYRRIKK